MQQLKTIDQLKGLHKDEMNEGSLVLDKQFDRFDKLIEGKMKRNKHIPECAKHRI
jgi:hypothetical protein